MLLFQSNLKNFALQAKDGEIGRSRDLLFDDEKWVLRYLEINTGKWLLGRRVLISPIFLHEPELEEKHLPVSLTKKEIEDAPGAETDEPISDRFERAFYGHFGYPYYWVGADLWGFHGYPAELARQVQTTPTREEQERIRNSHLRSMAEVTGYALHATDGDIGHVADFVVDTSNWAVRYLVVDTRRWLPGPRVLVAPQWIERVSWQDREVYVDLDKKTIEAAPKVQAPITGEDELATFKHFSASSARESSGRGGGPHAD